MRGNKATPPFAPALRHRADLPGPEGVRGCWEAAGVMRVSHYDRHSASAAVAPAPLRWEEWLLRRQRTGRDGIREAAPILQAFAAAHASWAESRAIADKRFVLLGRRRAGEIRVR